MKLADTEWNWNTRLNCSSCGRLQCGMPALAAAVFVSFLPLMTYAALTTGAIEPVSDSIHIPAADAAAANSSFLTSMEPTQAAGLNVAGASGGLTHPACVMETNRRAAMQPPQPPPNGDFPCIVPASNGAGTVDGVCFVNVCRGVSFTGLGGIISAVGSISSLNSVVSGIFGNLMQGGQNSSGGGAGDSGTVSTTATSPASSQLLSSDTLQPLDTTQMLNDSEANVRNLLFQLNPPGAQVH